MAALYKFLGASNVVPMGFWNENKNENIKEIWFIESKYSWKITKKFVLLKNYKDVS